MWPFKKKEKIERCLISDVKPGEWIYVEWSRIKGKIGQLKCLNNDPKTKKILLETNWGNYEEVGCNKHEKVIFEYSDLELKNFHLLNSIDRKSKSECEIEELNEKLNEAIQKENYEEADKIQRVINKKTKS